MVATLVVDADRRLVPSTVILVLPDVGPFMLYEYERMGES